jgi:8-hydroxy-5-deazaflavin:NADPH oxidoreductase
MRIAVIGAGNVGGGFSRAAVAAGHDVVIAAAHPEKAQAVAAEVGAQAAESNAAAAQGAQVVVLAVPAAEAPAVAAEVAASGAVVVDATNPLNATFDGLAIEGISGAEAVQKAAGSTPVVKAFNTVFASRYAGTTEQGAPLTLLIAGDDEAAKGTVAELGTSLGFAPVDAGSLRFARTLEELAFLNITLNAGKGWVWQNHFQIVGPTTA